ncbi:MAG: L,D-transpeptidase family protein [Verrucomicrobiota bacterium]
MALIENGAAVEGVLANDGHSLLGWAVAHQMLDVTKALLAAGADPDHDERSPARSEFREMFDSNTFKYHLQVDRRIRPIMMAAAHRNTELAQAIMDAGANGRAYTPRYLMAAIIGSWYKDADMQQIALLGEVPENQPRKVVVDLSSQRVTLYENGIAIFSTRCSTGKRSKPTPPGSYVISDRNRYHTSSIYGSSMPYFQRFSYSAFGLHQGHLPGYPASSGCIRLPWDAAKYLWGKLEVGDLAIVQY